MEVTLKLKFNADKEELDTPELISNIKKMFEQSSGYPLKELTIATSIDAYCPHCRHFDEIPGIRGGSSCNVCLVHGKKELYPSDWWPNCDEYKLKIKLSDFDFIFEDSIVGSCITQEDIDNDTTYQILYSYGGMILWTGRLSDLLDELKTRWNNDMNGLHVVRI